MSQTHDTADIKKRRGRKVRAMLVERGITITSIAQQLGVTVGTAAAAISGTRQSRPVKRAVAEVLGLTPRTLWPDDFDGAA